MGKKIGICIIKRSAKLPIIAWNNKNHMASFKLDFGHMDVVGAFKCDWNLLTKCCFCSKTSFYLLINGPGYHRSIYHVWAWSMQMCEMFENQNLHLNHQLYSSIDGYRSFVNKIFPNFFVKCVKRVRVHLFRLNRFTN